MKPSRNIIILTAIAAIVGGLSLAYVSAQRADSDPVSTDEKQEILSEVATQDVGGEKKVAATPESAINASLTQEVDALTKEFSSLSEGDFSETSLEDAQLGL